MEDVDPFENEESFSDDDDDDDNDDDDDDEGIFGSGGRNNNAALRDPSYDAQLKCVCCLFVRFECFFCCCF